MTAVQGVWAKMWKLGLRSRKGGEFAGLWGALHCAYFPAWRLSRMESRDVTKRYGCIAPPEFEMQPTTLSERWYF